jgi:hypothetical protein
MESELIPTPVDSTWSSMDNPFQIPSSPCTACILETDSTVLYVIQGILPMSTIGTLSVAVGLRYSPPNVRDTHTS